MLGSRILLVTRCSYSSRLASVPRKLMALVEEIVRKVVLAVQKDK